MAVLLTEQGFYPEICSEVGDLPLEALDLILLLPGSRFIPHGDVLFAFAFLDRGGLGPYINYLWSKVLAANVAAAGVRVIHELT